MSSELTGTEIAIVGMAGRFPGAKNIDCFWRNLREGVESITRFSDEELLKRGLDAVALSDPHLVKAASVLEDVEHFDAAFFDINHREAEITDPQHRLFLECAWEALESSGYDSARYEGAISVYGGATINTYLLCNLASNSDLINSLDPMQLNIANGGDFLTTRVSYKLNLKGPSHLIQSACSTSLVAVHAACQSLLHEECDMALAGGVSVNVRQQSGYRYLEGGIVSPDGHCRAFDAQAQGTVFGSGVGIVVLKRLEDALADSDTIHAIIKGSAVNNDGSLKVGYTAPSIDGQAEVVAEALANAGVEAETINYVEAHGTATPLGDPIEIRALSKAFASNTTRQQSCAIGTVKSNIGHLDAAAGITGLIKTVLALKHRQLPPSLHYQQPNPQIDFSASPFYVNTELREWEAVAGSPRRAGVSSFGVGGTNAHVVLEEAPEPDTVERSRGWQVLTLSAKTETALEAMTERLADYLQEHPGINLADVAFTLNLGRRIFSHRRAVICNNVDDAVRALRCRDTQRLLTGYQEKNDRGVAFLFSGQASQRPDMGRELYYTERLFRQHIDTCSEILKSKLGLDLRKILYPTEATRTEAAQQLNQTWLTQPALFTFEHALAQLWMSWGVRPTALIGHSLGEYVAACLSGVMSLEDALSIVAMRGRLMQRAGEGAMLAVALPESEIKGWLKDVDLDLAAVNAPSQCVVSGDKEMVQGLAEKLGRAGVMVKPLESSRAFHSRMMDGAVTDLVSAFGRIRLREPQIPYISNVTGKWIQPAEAVDPKYWGHQMREAVRYGDGIEELEKRGINVYLEVGPGQTLSRITRRQLQPSTNRILFASLNLPAEGRAEESSLLTTLGQLWLSGIPINWPDFYSGERRCRLPLPTYPFERQRYWIEPKAQPASATASSGAHTLASESSGSIQGPSVQSPVEATSADSAKPSLTLHPRPPLQNVFTAPATAQEQAVARIWERMLGVGPIGVQDNFFELGGDSLVAIQVIAQLQETFKKEIPVISLYECLTIRSLIETLGLARDEGPVTDDSADGNAGREEKALRRKQLLQQQRSKRMSRDESLYVN